MLQNEFKKLSRFWTHVVFWNNSGFLGTSLAHYSKSYKFLLKFTLRLGISIFIDKRLIKLLTSWFTFIHDFTVFNTLQALLNINKEKQKCKKIGKISKYYITTLHGLVESDLELMTMAETHKKIFI